MTKLLKRLSFLLVVLVLVGAVGGPRVAAALPIAFVGLLLALRNGYVRTISAEQFVLYDYQGRTRANLGGAMPPAGHVIGADWDSSPGLDLYYRNGEKALSMTVDFANGEGSAALALFRDGGLSRVGLANGPVGQGLSIRNARSNGACELRLDNTGEFLLVDALGNERRFVWP